MTNSAGIQFVLVGLFLLLSYLALAGNLCGLTRNGCVGVLPVSTNYAWRRGSTRLPPLFCCWVDGPHPGHSLVSPWGDRRLPLRR